MTKSSLSITFLLACLSTQAWGVTATYTNSTQNVTLTGLGGSNGVGQSLVTWGTCAFDGTNTNCTVTAPYTGVGGGGTISIVFSYRGNGTTPFTANSISAGSDLIRFGLQPGNSGSITVSLQESTGANVTFLTDNFVFFYALGATCNGVSGSQCSVGQVGLTPNATITGPVYGTFDQTPVIGAAITASAYGAFTSIAPATWMEIYGTNLANVQSQTWSGSDFQGNLAPSALGQTTVTVGGQSAYIDYVSPTQVNVQVPSNTGTGQQPVVVTTPGGTSAAYSINVNANEPGLLAPAVLKEPAGQYVVALASDQVTYILPPGLVSGLPARRAKPGDAIIFYGIGFGPVTPDSPAGLIVTQLNQINAKVEVSFGGVPATVSYDGLAGGYLGLYQFNVVVPNVPASDSVPVTFSVNGTPVTQTLITAITN